MGKKETLIFSMSCLLALSGCNLFTPYSGPDADSGVSPDADSGVSPDADSGVSPVADSGVSPVADSGVSPVVDAGPSDVDAGLSDADAGSSDVDAGPPPLCEGADLANDAENCGSCGFACAAGNCTDGMCQIQNLSISKFSIIDAYQSKLLIATENGGIYIYDESDLERYETYRSVSAAIIRSASINGNNVSLYDASSEYVDIVRVSLDDSADDLRFNTSVYVTSALTGKMQNNRLSLFQNYIFYVHGFSQLGVIDINQNNTTDIQSGNQNIGGILADDSHAYYVNNDDSGSFYRNSGSGEYRINSISGLSVMNVVAADMDLMFYYAILCGSSTSICKLFRFSKVGSASEAPLESNEISSNGDIKWLDVAVGKQFVYVIEKDNGGMKLLSFKKDRLSDEPTEHAFNCQNCTENASVAVTANAVFVLTGNSSGANVRYFRDLPPPPPPPPGAGN